jgi:hypothetical protein
MKPAWERIRSIAEVEPLIAREAISEELLLLIFDMDLTLTMPRLPAYLYLRIPAYRNKIERLLSLLPELERRKILMLGLQVSEQKLVEQDAPAIIKNIQARHIKTIVLTASLTGQINDEAPLELQRFHKLRDLGIFLEGSYTNQEIKLDDLPSYNASFPMYHRGILCANGAPGTNIKGPVLVSFLQHIQWKPTTIIMVDDKVEHLSNVCQSVSEFDPSIRFVGLEYTGAQAHVPQKVDEDAFMAYWQGLIDQVLNKSQR